MTRRPFISRVLWASVVLPGALATLGCDPGGFRRADTGTTNDLRGVYVVSKERTLAVGLKGTVLEFNGESVVDTSTDADIGPRIPSFYAVASSRGFDLVAGDQGIVLNRTEKDFVFDNTRRANSERLLFLTLATETSAYAGGEGGRVLHKELEGTEWARVDARVPADSKVTAAWAADDDHITLVTDKGVAVDLVDGSWVSQTVMTETATTPLPLFGAWSAGPGEDLFAVGLAGSIYKRDGETLEWTLEQVRGSQDLYAIFGTARDRIFAVGANGTIFRYDGAAWTGVPSGTSEDLYAIAGLPDGTFTVAVGSKGAMIFLEEE